MAEQKIHPALTISSIKNTFTVIDHIIPPPPPATSSTPPPKDAPPPKVVDPETWSTLDAIVLQWIYGTISNDLMHTILEPDTTAEKAWSRLKDIFQDNKNSRAVYLEHQFTNTRLDNFSSVSAYCQELKMLSDQLTNVGAPVSNNRLVLQLIAGLNESYDNVASFIQQSDPLPPFYEARSRLVLEETRKNKQAANASISSGTALVATAPSTTPNHKHHNNSTSSSNSPNPPPQRNDNSNRGRGRNNGYRGGGRNGGRGSGRGRSNNFHQSQFQQWTPYGTWAWSPYHWASPPHSFPTAPWSRPTPPPSGSQ
ncbi:retrovirus-related pol polyprotein from transposon TNT 1-94, partial [Tanacetum coccineum]